jgi:hypothetical protein
MVNDDDQSGMFEKNGPPRIVTITRNHKPFNHRNRKGRNRIFDEEISMISFDDGTTSATVEKFYSRFHPVVWMLLMFMSISLHSRYTELVQERREANAKRHDTSKRQVLESGRRNGEKSPDLSGIVMSLIEPMKDENSSESIDISIADTEKPLGGGHTSTNEFSQDASQIFLQKQDTNLTQMNSY